MEFRKVHEGALSPDAMRVLSQIESDAWVAFVAAVVAGNPAAPVQSQIKEADALLGEWRKRFVGEVRSI